MRERVEQRQPGKKHAEQKPREQKPREQNQPDQKQQIQKPNKQKTQKQENSEQAQAIQADVIRKQLEGLADEKYRIFSSSLTPGKDNILGVRLPLLRKLAKEIAKGDWRTYLAQAGYQSFEEVMLKGMVIGYVKADTGEVLKLAADFIPLIDNWAVCDSFCNGLKITKTNRETVWEFLQPYLNSGEEFEIRFGVVMILNYYILPEYLGRAFEHFNRIRHPGYYVKMAVAWAISIYYIAFPEQTYDYLLNNQLDDFTYNKALQKITESLRIDDNTKKMIRGMKRLNN